MAKFVDNAFALSDHSRNYSRYMNDRRVVITGLGVVTPVGNDLVTFWDNLKNGVSGIGMLDSFDTTGYDCRIGGQVRNFEPKDFFNNPKDVRRTDRFAQLAMAAAKMAKTDSGIDLEKTNRERFGVIVSSGIGGLKTLEDQHSALVDQRPEPRLALHHSDAHQQHGERPDLDGVRAGGTKLLHRHRLRHLQQRDRRILAHD